MKPVPGTKYKQFQHCKKTTKQTPRSNSDSTDGIQGITTLHQSSHTTLHYSKAVYKQRRESPSFSHLLLPYQEVAGGEEDAWHDSITTEQLVIDA